MNMLLWIIFVLLMEFRYSNAVVVSLGTSFSVNCSLPISENSIIFWQKRVSDNRFNYLPFNSTKYRYTGFKSKTLTIYHLVYVDTGNYRCVEYINRNYNYGQQIEVNVTDKPVITTNRPNVYIERGKDVTLDVNIYSQSTTTIVWIKKQRLLTNSVKHSINNYDLTVRNVQEADDGQYTASAANIYGTTEINIRIISGYIPTIGTPRSSITAQMSTDATLAVDIHATYPPAYRVVWTKNGNNIDVTEWKYVGGSVDEPNLIIKRVEATDDGTYTCKIFNGIGYGSVDVSLLSWTTPVLSVNSNLNIARGTTGIIRITVTSKPEVKSIRWKKGKGSTSTDIQFTESTKYESIGSLKRHNLKIINVDESDSGFYTCTANNGYSQGSVLFTLNVGEITPVSIPVNYYVSKVKDNVILQCLINDDPSNRNIYWKKGSNYIYSTNSLKYSGGNITNPSLTIKTVKLSDVGKYECHLSTLYGPSYDSVDLKVLFVNAWPGQIQKVANQTAKLQCSTKGGNSLKWRHNDKKINITDDNEYTGGTLAYPTLTITKLTRWHAGNYTCETSYDAVTAVSSVITLTIEDIPLVRSSTDIVEGATGKTIRLECSHVSNPEPNRVFWKKNGVDITMHEISSVTNKYNGSTISDPSLTIFNTDLSDSGIYECGFENAIGIGYGSSIQVVIRDPEEANSAIGPIAGGIGAAIVILVVIIIVVILIKRKKPRMKKRTEKTNARNAEDAVRFNPDRDTQNSDKAYINIVRMSATAPNDDAPSQVFSSGTQNDETTYYNVTDLTSIKVDELKKYIDTKQQNEELKEDYKSIPYGAEHPTTIAQQKDNIPKNRFKTTFPYDHTRVILDIISGADNSDYINGNYLNGFQKDKCYIAAQGPTKLTLHDHWRMIWQNNTRKIVMLTNLVEGGKAKCERYWPLGGKQMTFGNLVLTLITEKERAAYITREIAVEDKKTKEKRFVIQYHFTAWPDHGTPDPLHLVLFHRHVTSDHILIQSGPLLVHCSAGIGRTGTYIALDSLLAEGRAKGRVDIIKFLKQMRYSRMNMIQTPDQYVCLHYALLEAFTMNETIISKDKFSEVWGDIQSSKLPIEQRRIHTEFKMLESKKPERNESEYTDARSRENVSKNRCRSVLPMDSVRLFLVSYGKGRTNYINAVQVPSYTQFVGYITTQLPLADTIVDFWTMIRDHHSSTIVVLLDKSEEANMVCPESSNDFTCGPFTISVTKRETGEQDITEATLNMSNKDDKPKDIAVYQAVFNKLPHPQVLCRLVDLISTRISMTDDPVTVVSSDGAKNCGLFCAFINAVSSMKIDETADIFHLVRLLQLRRPEFFTDFEEYRLCYETLNVYLESSNVYANF